MKDARSILIRPLLTEKSVEQATRRKYAFEVARTANKVEIRRAVEQLFPGTEVSAVNTLVVRGKRRRLGGYRRRYSPHGGSTATWKKAIVTLRAGSIPAFEGL